MRFRHLLEEIQYVEPGPITKAYLDTVHNSRRYIDLSSFKRTSDGKCGWCNAENVRGKVRKYCGVNCRESAEMYCYPQRPSTKAWLFINRQNCTCYGCGEIFEDAIDKKIERRQRDMEENHRRWQWKITKVTYFSIGRDTGRLWQVDHIVPLWRGGRGIGLENIQIVCANCHGKKTASEAGQRSLSQNEAK